MSDQQSIQYLDTDQLQPNPLQPRGAIGPETIMELVKSIRDHGILEPLVVAHTPAGYQIIAGERRWKAAKMAGLYKLPCIIRETTPQKMLELAIVENVQREDLNALERAKAFQRLIDEFDKSINDVASSVGKSSSYVSNTLKLLELPDALKDGLISEMITEGHARALLGIKDKSLMIEAYKQILRESGSVRRAEELARRVKFQMEKDGLKEVAQIATKRIVHEHLDKIQEDLNLSLGTNSDVKLVQSQRQTKLIIVLIGNPDQTKERLDRIYHGVTNNTAKPDSSDKTEPQANNELGNATT